MTEVLVFRVDEFLFYFKCAERLSGGVGWTVTCPVNINFCHSAVRFAYTGDIKLDLNIALIYFILKLKDVLVFVHEP